MRRRIESKRDRVRQLRAFCEAVRLGSVTGAAERLGITQPAVSLQVRELEHELGAMLLERTRAGVAPTEAGERLFALAAPLVEGVDALFGDLADCLDEQDAQRVRVAATNAGAAFVLPRYVARLHARHPDTAVRVDTDVTGEGLERLLDERVDCALGTLEPYPEDRFAYRELFAYGQVLITALDHPLAGRARVTLHEAVAYRVVVPPADSRSRQLCDRAARGLGLAVDTAVEVGGYGILKRYVEAGVGISLVPSFVVNAGDRLAVVALDAEFPAQSFGVFTVRGQMPTPAARRLLDVLQPGACEPP